MNIYLKDLVRVSEGILIKGDNATLINSFSIDTRTLKKGEVYLGIKGSIVDGNTFYKEAITKGASGCILDKNTDVDREFLKDKDVFILLVDDVILSLQQIATYKRSRLNIPVVAITGSVGKTSTKDMVASVLSTKYKVLKTEGNLNNHLGLPLTIMKYLDEDIMVLEMGMNNLGEIRVLSNIAKPTLSVITNIGTSHIGNLGSRENILKAKLEILEGMDEKVLVINNDNDLLHNLKIDGKIITYGINNKSDYNAYDIKYNLDNLTYKINLLDCTEEIKINVPTESFVLNSLGALSVGMYYDIEIDKIKEGLETFKLSSNRMEIEKINNITFIKDYYNASVDSINSTLSYLSNLKGRKIAVLGDMLELGKYSKSLHEMVGKSVYEKGIDILITVGNDAKYIADEALKLGFNKNNIFTYIHNREASLKLLSILESGDIVLLKASHGMNFKEIYSLVKDGLKNI